MIELKDSPDNAGVVVRPPLLYGVAVMDMGILNVRWPWPIFHGATGAWCGMAVFASAVVVGIQGRNALKAADTAIDPMRPTTTVVINGPYRWSRNPIYVALTLAYAGLALLLDTWWGALIGIAVLGVMHRGVVLREESYLARKFGNAYDRYRGTVRRYL